MGWNASDTRPLSFDDCRVPEENLLGRRGAGLQQFLHILDIGRIGVAAMGVGLAQGALDQALAYAKERRAFGQPISKFQSIQAKLADLSTEIEATRLLVHKAAWLKDAGRNFTLTAAQAKLKSGRLAVRAADEAVQIHGGYGYIEEYPVCRFYRDAKILDDRRGHRRGPADGDRAGAGGVSSGPRRRRCAGTPPSGGAAFSRSPGRGRGDCRAAARRSVPGRRRARLSGSFVPRSRDLGVAVRGEHRGQTVLRRGASPRPAPPAPAPPRADPRAPRRARLRP